MKLSFLRTGFLLSLFTVNLFSSFAQTPEEQKKITDRYNLPLLQDMARNFNQRELSEKQAAVAFAKANNLPLTVKLDDGGFAEVQRLSPDGKLLYYRTFNVSAARSTRTNHLNIGGTTGYNLDGQNMIAYVWDGGHALVTHQEYDGPGGTDRVSVQDAATEGGTQLNYHAAHVTGTIVASGVVANAKGMAPQGRVRGYMWNSDLSEATTAASNGMLISSHSYGYNSTQVPDYYFGAYITDSRDWDNLMFNAPFYLMVKAAGNDGTTNYNGAPLNTSLPQYDKLTGDATSKNNLVVASCNDASVDNNGNLTAAVTISSFSSQGPTDDLRIKPDITGNGASVYSTYETSPTAYNSISGTSMATPNVSGSLLLLQQHANNVRGAYLRAATLKGLVLHTADDAGATGPDAIFGWGLMNAKRAAEVITANGTTSIVNELTLTSGQTYTINVTSDGISRLMASISWTDRPGTATTALNSTTARLVNDLDIRISKDGTTFFPWRLTAVNANGLGDNTKDPFERAEVTGASGTYTITVSHKGTLTGGSQNFSLIVTGIVNNVVCNATTPTGLTPAGVGATTALLNWDAVAGATYDVRYRAVGAANWITVVSATNSYSLTGLSPLTQYEAQVSSKCVGGSTSAFSASVNFTTTEQQLVYCSSNGNSVADEYIGRVQLGTINNASGSGNGYSDFTNISTSLTKGTQYTITITPTWTGTVYAEGYSVWIDYNKDGDFDDAGEQVMTRAATTATPVSAAFTVPSTAVASAVRMRVSMKYNAVPTACESFAYGEVEDYTVNLVEPLVDTEAPAAPTNLAVSNVTSSSVNLTWNASTDNVGVTAYEVYVGGVLNTTVTGTTTTVSGLAASTNYNFFVKAKDAAGNVSASSNVVSATTLPAPDTQAPSAPLNLAASNVTQTTLTLSWNASTDNVGVVGYDVYSGATLLGTVTGTSANVTGLTASTTYSFSVRAKDAAGNVSASSNVVTVTTLANAVTYCTSRGNSTSREFINRVVLGSINNTSGNNSGYGNFTSFSTTLVKGTSNTITITPGWTSSARSEAYRVWIDYNRDGDFADAGEQVFNRNRTTSTPISGSFTVPSTALNGTTRMRVSMKYNASPTSCETFASGEVEDYTVNISTTTGQDFNVLAVSEVGAPQLELEEYTESNDDWSTDLSTDIISLEIYPNPVSGQALNIMLEGELNEGQIKVYNLMGQLAISQPFTNTLDVSNLKAGTYAIEISGNGFSTTKRFIIQ